MKPRGSQHHRHPAGGADIRPHPNQLIHMAVAAAKKIFLEYRRPPAPQQRRHHNGLRVGGKTGIGCRADGAWRVQPPRAPAGDPRVVPGDFAARLPECRCHSGQMRLPGAPQKDVAPGGGRPAEVGGRRNAVGNHRVCTAVQGPSSPDYHGGGAAPGNLSAAGIQKVLQILNFRLPGGVGEHRDALRPAGGQHQILRGPHRGKAQHDFPACQLRRFTVQPSSGIVNVRSQCPKA